MAAHFENNVLEYAQKESIIGTQLKQNALNNKNEYASAFCEREEKEAQSKLTAKLVSIPFSLSTALALSIIAGVGTCSLFGLSWVWLIGFTALGFILDAIVYKKSVAKTFQLLRHGPLTFISDLKKHTYTQHLLAKQNVLDYIDTLLAKKVAALKIKIEKKHQQITDPRLYASRIDVEINEKKQKLRQKMCSTLLLRAKLMREKMMANYLTLHPDKTRKDAKKAWQQALRLTPENQQKYRFLAFCQELEAIKQQTQPLWIFKASLIGLGTFFPLGIGVAFGSMGAINIVEMFTLFFGLSLSGGVITAAVVGGFFLGLTYSLLMYKYLYSAVSKNIFKTMREKLSVYPKYKMDRTDMIAHVIGSTLKVLMGGLMLIIGIIAIFFSAGALIDATFKATMAVLEWSDKLALTATAIKNIALVINIVMSILIIPIRLVFGIKHSFGAAHKVGQAVLSCVNLVREKKYVAIWEDIKQHPAKVPFYIIGFVGFMIALGIHTFTDAIAFPAKGAASEIARTGRIYQKITSGFMSLATAIKVMAIGCTVQELCEHGDMAVDDATTEGFSITRLPYDFTFKGIPWLKNWFCGTVLKEPKSSVPVESKLIEEPTEEPGAPTMYW